MLDIPPPNRRAGSDALLGVSFVLVWCTGYIAGKLVVGHAAPLTSLVMRSVWPRCCSAWWRCSRACRVAAAATSCAAR